MTKDEALERAREAVRRGDTPRVRFRRVADAIQEAFEEGRKKGHLADAAAATELVIGMRSRARAIADEYDYKYAAEIAHRIGELEAVPGGDN